LVFEKQMIDFYRPSFISGEKQKVSNSSFAGKLSNLNKTKN